MLGGGIVVSTSVGSSTRLNEYPAYELGIFGSGSGPGQTVKKLAFTS